MTAPSWPAQAACRAHISAFRAVEDEPRGKPPGRFLADVSVAMNVCDTCPVVVPCARRALSEHIAGVAGRMDYRTRCRLRSHAGNATVDERRLHSMDKCRRCGRAEARAA